MDPEDDPLYWWKMQSPRFPGLHKLAQSYLSEGFCLLRCWWNSSRSWSPLAGKSPSHVRNSADFVNQIHQTSLEETDVMASFDVVSLFTRVPVNEALLVISQRLQQDDTLKDRTSIPIPDLCAPVELCLKSTYFQFGKSFYEQVEGAAMGSPLSPIVANIFLEDLETRALETSAWKPKMWRRYVDDVLVVWPHGDQLLEEFHQHLNKQNPSIQLYIAVL